MDTWLRSWRKTSEVGLGRVFTFAGSDFWRSTRPGWICCGRVSIRYFLTVNIVTSFINTQLTPGSKQTDSVSITIPTV